MSSRYEVCECISSDPGFFRPVHQLTKGFGKGTSIIRIGNGPARSLVNQLSDSTNPHRRNDWKPVGTGFQKDIWQTVVQSRVEHRIKTFEWQLRKALVWPVPEKIGSFCQSIPKIVVREQQVLHRWEPVA